MRQLVAKSRIHQAGVTLLEVLLALTIATSLLIGISSYLWDQTRAQQDVTVAQFHNLVTQAAQNYIQDNYSSIQAGTFPASITITQLISGGYLSSGMASANSLGQTVCVKIVQPTASTLSALVMGTGATTTYNRAAHIAGLIGTLGGAVDTTGAINGTGGSWTIGSSTAASYGTCSSGSLAIGQFVSMLYFSNGSLVSDFLHRSYVGNLTANTMNVPLGLSVQTSGATCSSTYVGFIARDSSGNILACVNSSGTYTWTATSGSWKSPVASYSALPTTGNSDGDARMELTNHRAYVWNSTLAAWKSIAVDDSGNMTIPNILTVGSSTISGSSTNTVIGQSGSLKVMNTAGTAYTDAYVGRVVVNTTATLGAACTPNGALAQNGSGTFYTCTSGYWTSMGQKILWAQFNGSANTFGYSSGFSSATHFNTGHWYVYFTTPFSNTSYSIVASSQTDGSVACGAIPIATTYAMVTCTFPDHYYADMSQISIMAIGN